MIEAVSRFRPQLPAQGEPQRLHEAAVEFEALLLAQMLKSMREDRGWMGTGEDHTGASMLEIAEEHLVRVIASQGGLGLAGLILSGLLEGESAARAPEH